MQNFGKYLALFASKAEIKMFGNKRAYRENKKFGRIHAHPLMDESSIMDLKDDSSVNFWARFFFIFCQILVIFDHFSKLHSVFSALHLKNGKNLAKNEENSHPEING